MGEVVGLIVGENVGLTVGDIVGRRGGPQMAVSEAGGANS